MLKCVECGESIEPGLRDNIVSVLGETVQVSKKCEECGTWNIISYGGPYICHSYKEGP